MTTPDQGHTLAPLGYGRFRCLKCRLSGYADTPQLRILCPRAGLGENFAVGDLVIVGPAYRMAEQPPYEGHHTYAHDEITGYVGCIVKLDGDAAELAPANLLDVDESDADLSVTLKRLRKA